MNSDRFAHPRPTLLAGLLALALTGTMATMAGSLVACSSQDASSSDAGSEPADTCQLSPQRAWVIEGQPLEVVITCASGLALTDLSIENLPEGVSFAQETQTLTWLPNLDQAAVYHLPMRAPSLGAKSELQIGVADAFENPDNLPIVDPTLYTMELGLPVLFLASEPSSDSSFEPMNITYGGEVFAAEAKLRGKSSLDYPKRSYALRFDKFHSFGESEFANFSNRTRVILTSTFDDNSYVRQRMAFKLWSLLEPSVPVEAYNAVVYRGSEYRGIYTVTDHINADLMKRHGLSEDANLYKAESHDANFRSTDTDGNSKSNLHQGYTKPEGTPAEGQPGAFDDLDELVDFVANADDASFEAGIEERIDVDDYASWWLLATFSLAYDTAGKNSYHYHDAVRTWRVIPWDFNSSFGQEWETSRAPADDYSDFFGNNRLFERLMSHPSIGPQIRARYRQELESGVFSPAALSAMMDAYEAEIGPSAARDWSRWEDEYYSFDRWSSRDDFTSEQEELSYLRAWLLERSQFVLDNYLGDL